MSIKLSRALVLALVCAVIPLSAPGQQVGGGVINTVAGTGTAGFSGDGGPGTQAMLNFFQGELEDGFGHLAVDPAGNLYIADNGNHRIRKLDTNGVITTFAGTGFGYNGDERPAAGATLSYPCGLAVDVVGRVYIADQANNRIRRVDLDGIIHTVAGSGDSGYSGDGGRATEAKLKLPCAVAVDAAYNIYIADFRNNRVRKVDGSTGVITTIAGDGRMSTNWAGQDNIPATSATVAYPSGLVVDRSGAYLFIADHFNNVIRVVDLRSGLIRRIAGTGEYSYSSPLGNGGPATKADLSHPVGLAMDAAGNLWVADRENNAIRKISSPLSPGATISTPVGAGYYGFGGDGTPAWTAGFAYPSGVAIDKAGNLFIADWHNQRVRKVTPGAGQPVISPDGVVNGASSARGAAGLAPGSVVSIFGQWLAPYAAKATAVPLPRTVFHAPVSANVRAGAVTAQMPLFYVSPDQINAQLPVELPLGPASVTVQTANVESLPIAITIVPAAPGIFVYEDNRAVALNQDSRLNRTILPAERGSIISVYLTGQGELSPPVPSGQAAPLDVLSWAVMSPAASIGGVPAPVVFLGAAPGFVGLAQANITVPMDAPVGDQPLSITIGGVESNRPKISIK